ncbi:MAG: DLW-39 family protein [Actinomycetota bacterium]
MKKIILMVTLAATAFGVWRKMEADKAEQDLWARNTDAV